MKRQRTLWQVNNILERRYGRGVHDLLDSFVDMECFRTLETLISYGPRETGGEDSDAWQEYKALSNDFTIDFDQSCPDAYRFFKVTCNKLGLNVHKTFDLYSQASGYWGFEDCLDFNRGTTLLQASENHDRYSLRSVRSA